MKVRHLPPINFRYWVLISMASLLGANVGDFLSVIMGLGNLAGLPVLAVALALVFVSERLDRSMNEFHYWLPIVLVRAAATNIADFASMDLHLSRLWLILAGTALLALVIAVGRQPGTVLGPARPRPGGAAFPAADGRYWIAMLVAGVLGTVAGDWVSYAGPHLGNVEASLILSLVLAGILLVGRGGLLIAVPYYWLGVVAVRAAGTAVGDMLAHAPLFGLGLAASTMMSCGLFILTLAGWKQRAPRLAWVE